nr:MAG TPA: hypothetical protein [Caudoviricetes sp.]
MYFFYAIGKVLLKKNAKDVHPTATKLEGEHHRDKPIQLEAHIMLIMFSANRL